MRKYNLAQYNNVLKLRNKGLGSLRISKLLGINRSTIEGWINRGIKPYYLSKKRKKAVKSKENIVRLRAMSKTSQPKAVRRAAELKTKNLPKSAKKLTKELAYILGVIYGDGHVSIKQRRVILSAIDKDFVTEFKDNLEKWSNFKARFYQRIIKPSGDIKKRKPQWATYIDSVEASKFLQKFDLDNIVKSNKLNKRLFLRGIFDSEGSVSKDSIILYNTDYELILFARELLKSLSIHSNLNIYTLKNNKKYYRLCIYGKNRNIYLKNIGFSIQRKQRKLEKQLTKLQS